MEVTAACGAAWLTLESNYSKNRYFCIKQTVHFTAVSDSVAWPPFIDRSSQSSSNTEFENFPETPAAKGKHGIHFRRM